MAISNPGQQPPTNQDWIAPDRVGKPSQVFAQYMASLDSISRQLISAFNSLLAAFNGRACPKCGYLSFVSTTALQFLPFLGDQIKINGVIYSIPSGGIVGLANTGVFVNGVANQNLAASTLYYIYCFNNNGVLTADFGTTGQATSSTAGNVGVQIKPGDDTRSLIGLCRVNGSAQFEDAVGTRNVLSWFNRKPKQINFSFGNASTAQTGATNVAIYGTQPTFATWGDVTVELFLDFQANDTVNGQFGSVGYADNSAGNVIKNQFIFGNPNGGNDFGTCTLTWDSAFSEGFHQLFISGYGSGTGTASTLQVINANLHGHVWG